MELQDHGIWLFRASRLEALLDPLLSLLDATRPDDVLEPQTVIAAHPGMREWLLAAIARKRGLGAIVANLDVVLPSAWLDRLAVAVLGQTAVALRPYRREHLRWRIHALLPGIDDERIRRYLQGRDSDRRRFQLADQLARIFVQYLVYRPDWLAAWAAGRDAMPDPGFLKPLWKQLRSQIGQPHRGEMLNRLIATLDRTNTHDDAAPVHVFGISHLAPTDLAVLRVLAKRRLVIFYVPDPCRAFWAGMPNERTRLRQLVEREDDAAASEAAFLEFAHPLLANWGRIGQHFLLLLEDGEIAIDQRHIADEVPGTPRDQLERLQESIRASQPELARSGADPPGARSDRSLRVHACHTRLRELEVLRDALLRELAERPDLRPSDILVMAPDIQAYAPLLPAVFGPAGRWRGPLPYHIADVAIARSHPLFDAFARLLALPRSRLTAPEVVDLLAVPQIADRFGLTGQDVETIAGWLREARVAWALDAKFRARFEVPAIEAQTFGWGMDRMLAGYAMGSCDESEGVAILADGGAIAPLDGTGGPQAELAGALDSLLVELARWCAAGEARRSASAWAAWLGQRLAAIVRIDADDAGAVDADEALARAIRSLVSEPAESGLDPELDFDVVRDVLLAALAQVSERQNFLMGGATFCGMVVQRAIPFRVVAVLGLDDGRFPRAIDDGGLDPMLRHRRIGDRDVRNDDRYLFLQTVMSAREVLHLSYVGEGVRDGKPRNPAAPLADLMGVLDPGDEAPGADDDEAARVAAIARRPWFVRHPLQPFDDRYFDGRDPALFSYRKEFAELDPRARPEEASPFLLPSGEEPAPDVIGGGAAAPDEGQVRARTSTLASPLSGPAGHPLPVGEGNLPSGATEIQLRDLLAYFRDPAKYFLTQRMKLRLDALDDDRLRDSESLEARVGATDRVAHRVFMDALEHPQRGVPDQPPAWLSLTGLLPPGRPGRTAWDTESKKSRELLEAAHEHPLFANGTPIRESLSIEVACGGRRVVGEPTRVYTTAAARWVFDAFPGKQEKDLDFRQRIGLFIEWAVVRIVDTTGAVRLYAACERGKNPWQDAINGWDEAYVLALRHRDERALAAFRADIDDRLREFLDLWSLAQDQPPPYYPKTSWAAATQPEDIDATWSGGYNRTGERDYAPGYARLLAGESLLAENEAVRAELFDLARRLHACITLGAASADTER